jgi:hypothetical protein
MDGETDKKRKRLIIAGVVAVTLVVALGFGLVANRGGLGDLTAGGLRATGDCRLEGDRTVVSTLRFRGHVSGGSLSLGAFLEAKRRGRGGETVVGHERFEASGRFDRTFDVSVEMDEPVEDVDDVRCLFGMSTGFHWPGR